MGADIALPWQLTWFTHLVGFLAHIQSGRQAQERIREPHYIDAPDRYVIQALTIAMLTSGFVRLPMIDYVYDIMSNDTELIRVSIQIISQELF